MCTLLWTNARGLQVLRNNVEVEASAISTFGIPTTTGSFFFPGDDKFCDVQVDYKRHPLIFTIGNEWHRCGAHKRSPDIIAPVLHRVHTNGHRLRVSLPFFVRFVE